MSAQQEARGLSAATERAESRFARFVAENGTLVMVVGAFAMAMLATLQGSLAADGWLALLAGRLIAAHGLPMHDTLTIWAQGRRWVDQQWLSQLGLYGLWRAGGIRLVLLVHTALAVAGLAGAAALARRLGGAARSAAGGAPPALLRF